MFVSFYRDIHIPGILWWSMYTTLQCGYLDCPIEVFESNRNTIPHKYINYHVKAKQHSKPLLVTNRVWKICGVPNPLLYSWSFFCINMHSQPIIGASPLVCLYLLSFCCSLSVFSNISALIPPCASRSASHSHFPHFTYFLRSFTGTCQQNLPANLLADVDIFQEYVRHCTRNLNKMKKKMQISWKMLN